MTAEVTLQTSEAIWNRIREEALKSLKDGNKRASSIIETLERVKVICDAILSGDALTLAGEMKADRSPFRAKLVKEDAIAAFTKLKGWKGPHPVTIRKHEGYRDYVTARNAEVAQARIRPKSRSSRELDRMVDRVPSLEDRAEIRRHLEIGRQAKAELDLVLHMLTKLPGVDLDAINAAKTGKYELNLVTGSVDEPTRKILLTLVRRITDNEGFLTDFDLVFRNGRIKMDYGTGQDLIFPEEIATLSRLAWFQPSAESLDIDSEIS
jgi:hypothetical protein